MEIRNIGENGNARGAALGTTVDLVLTEQPYKRSSGSLAILNEDFEPIFSGAHHFAKAGKCDGGSVELAVGATTKMLCKRHAQHADCRLVSLAPLVASHLTRTVTHKSPSTRLNLRRFEYCRQRELFSHRKLQFPIRLLHSLRISHCLQPV